ncbi:MAG TPA: AMP-binding protein [Streptosporangiaceae bacterium]
MNTRPLHAVLLPPRAGAGRVLDMLAAALDGTGPAILPLDPALPRARLDEIIAAFAPSAIIKKDGTELPAAAGAGGRPDVGVGEDVAVVLATSGSTGLPKGAELTAAALVASARAALTRLGASPGERWLCGLPLHHISGLGILVRSLLAGTEPVLRDRIDAGAVAGAVPDGADDAGRCSYVSLVPTQLRRLLDAGAPVGRFRAILLGGAAIPPGMLAEAAAAGATIVTTYGMTETCGGCVYDARPLDGVQVMAGPDGRLRIAGDVLFARYRLAPELTEAALRDGWFVTSDLGEVGADGSVVVRGRADDVIISGGEKVVAGEVEQVLRTWDRVRDAIVVGTPDPDWGECVTALIVPANGTPPPGLDDVRAFVRDRLPRYAAPRAVLTVGALPMLSSGKPDRQQIRDIAVQHLAGQE